MIVNSGLPGGCGIPSTYAAAMYSDVSQNWVVGARVATYSTRAPRATQPAIRYGGCCSSDSSMASGVMRGKRAPPAGSGSPGGRGGIKCKRGVGQKDRKSTRLNSSHDQISYAVFCLKKKKKKVYKIPSAAKAQAGRHIIDECDVTRLQ